MTDAHGVDDGAAAAAAVDMADGSMLCSKHPFKNNHNNPGGICAFCLQEKLGKLVSSSLPIAVFPSSSNSNSHSFRSESSAAVGSGSNTSAVNRSFGHSLSTNNGHGNNRFGSGSNPSSSYRHRSRIIPFLTYRRKKTEDSPSPSTAVFKRSKSTTTPSRGFLDADVDSPQRRRFWSFLYHSKHGSAKNRPSTATASSNSGVSSSARTTPGASFSQKSRAGKESGGPLSSARRRIEGEIAEEEEEEDNEDSPGSLNAASFERKVSRSRSVGCGSRSFSGDFFERLSTGLGDCTLRRVESQRDGNNKSKVAAVRNGDSHSHSCMKERVRCGGIFGGFIMTSSSSSSSSSSQWVSTVEDAGVHGRSNSMNATVNGGQLVHGRSRSWAWAFASPMRAFSKATPEKDSSKSNKAPDLAAIPSLLSVSS